MVYRTQARQRASEVRIVLRKGARWWTLLLVMPLVVSWWRLSTFHVRVTYLTDCIDNCERVDEHDLAQRDDLAANAELTLALAIGALVLFAVSLGTPRTVVAIDRSDGIIRVSGRGLVERVSFADAPLLVVRDHRLMLTARERQPIILTHWYTPLATIDRLRAALDDATA